MLKTYRLLASLALGLVALSVGAAHAHHERVFVDRQKGPKRGPRVKLGFMGAAGGQVTGSMHVLQVGDKRMLVDAGAQQGERRDDGAAARQAVSLDAALKADAIVLTHAHLDHIGRLPILVKNGFKGKIFATPATAALAEHLLRDSAKIEKSSQIRDTKRGRPRELRFTDDDVSTVLGLLETHEFDKPFQPIPGVNLRFTEAGHIIGAASLDLEIGGFGKIRFSGDIGRQNSMLYNPPKTSPGNRAIVMESTYGDRQHPRSDPKGDLATALKDAIARGGKVVIPAFSLGRTQEILYILNQLYREGKVRVPVYLDSPLGSKVTDVYRKFLGNLSTGVRAFASKNGGDPFRWPMLREIGSWMESEALAKQSGPGIIIAGSGMVTGGRIVGHIQRFIEDPMSTILFVGYQGEGTQGRRILDMADRKDATTKIFGKEVRVRARIQKLGGFSGHADQDELTQWAKESTGKPAKIYIVHGQSDAQKALGKRLTGEGHKTTVPAHAQEADPEDD